MRLCLVSGNKHKFDEISRILGEHGIRLEWERMSLHEDPSLSLEETARSKAEQAFSAMKKPVIAEDTGVFFEAFNNFPGAQAKRFFEQLGFDGLLKKLEGKSRKARFETVICFTADGQEFKLFRGVLRGSIDEKVRNPGLDVLPYEKIFIPDGMQCTVSDIPRAEKNKFSHRAIAAGKLAKFLAGGKV